MTEPIPSVVDILGAGGVIARRLQDYEPRPEQLEMALAVESALTKRHHLIAEAGTGVGKSFAYLIPAILAAQAERGPDSKKRRIIVSTHTISLQEQLIQHDIPFLQSVLPVEFSAVLVKGRNNYISLRRLDKAVQRSTQKSLFEPDGQQQLAKIRQWAHKTTDGTRSDLAFQPKSDVWDEVLSDHGDCLRKKCPSHNDCFYYAARRRVWNADLLIVNHALFFSDLSLRRDDASILPEYDTVIFDEAHTIESVAADHLGISVTEGQVDYLLNKLYNEQANRGLLITHNLKNELTPELSRMAIMIGEAASAATTEANQVELKSAGDRCKILADNVQSWTRQSVENSVYWVERSGTYRQRLSLMSAPVEVGPILREHLYNAIPSVIMTSATLATGKKDFSFFRSRVGLTEGSDIRLGSPFNYETQTRLILSTNMADPSVDAKRFEQQCCERIQRHLLDTQGRAFVLFTSYSMMQFCADRLTGWLAQHDLSLYCQGKGLPRSAMLDRFRADERAVLFGTDSFWQGVNVPGDALQNVIIPRLPFSVPDHPLLEARLETIRSRGGNPFRDFQTPEAIIKLKQGFGRLIRHRNDTGRVVILDPRVLTKTYGRLFIASLPKCRTEIDNGESIEPIDVGDS